MVKIKDIDFGIAFRINDTIYLHKNLKNYPRLKNALIKHEKGHTNTFKIKDIKTDLRGKHLNNVKREYYKFLFKEPNAWKQLLPFLKVNEKWNIDLILTGVYLIAIIMLWIIIRSF